MSTRGRVVLGAGALLTAVTLALPGAAFAAKGAPGVSGGGGGNRPPAESVGNSLSVPAMFVGMTSNPFGLTCPLPAPKAPSGTSGVFPGDFSPALLTQEDGTATPTGTYYIQGDAVWQADCGYGAAGLEVAADWGDNLAGDASLKVGAPVRVEMGLIVDETQSTEAAAMKGYTVLKLTDELDRVATYGTRGVLDDLGEVRAYVSGATWTIGEETITATAEMNATGRIVYGYNWTPKEPGEYKITFTVPTFTVPDSEVTSPSVEITGVSDNGASFTATTTSITVNVAASTGGGGGGGGGGFSGRRT